MTDIRCEEVIISNLRKIGKGVKEDPIRRVTEVFTKEGELIASNDHYVKYTKEQMMNFARFVSPEKRIDDVDFARWEAE